MGFKVVNTIHLPGMDFGEKLLAGTGSTLVNAMGRTEDEIIANAADADAVICSGPVQPWTGRVIKSLAKCRIIASLGVGYDRIDLDAAADSAIAVTNIPAYCIDEVSAQAIALMLALGRKLFQCDRAVREKNVNFVPPARKNVTEILSPMFRLSDQTAGIFGFGKIGRAAAMKAKGLGMTVIAHDPHVLDEVIESCGIEPVDFEELLARSDYLSIHSSLNGSTRNRFDMHTLKKMKPTAYIINTARGEIINEPDLINAITGNVISGAGLDVTENDPVPAGAPILNVPGVILTGHSGWFSATADSEKAFWHRAMEQAVYALEGKWPPYAVNPEIRKKWMERWGKK